MHSAFFDEVLRRAIRVSLTERGVPAQFHDEIADMACHAAQAALDRCEEIIFAHPDARVQITAFSIATSLLIQRARQSLDAQKAVGNAIGATVEVSRLRVQR